MRVVAEDVCMLMTYLILLSENVENQKEVLNMVTEYSTDFSVRSGADTDKSGVMVIG